MRTDSFQQPPLIAEGLYSYQIGGSERVGVDLAIGFKNRGYRSVAFAFQDSDGPFRRELESHGVECVDLNYLRRPRATRRISFQLEFYRFLKSRKVSALHIQHATSLLISGIPTWLARVRKFIVTEHSIHQYVERPDEFQIAKDYSRFASTITGVHSGITDYFRDKLYVLPERLHVVPNGVHLRPADPALRQSMRDQLGIPQGKFVFLYAGRLEDVKDLHTLLGAAARLPRDLAVRATVVLAGDGSCRAELEAAAREQGLGDRVRFLGARTDIPNLLAMADAFVMTSRTEGLPMAMIEAMGAGLPCVSTAVGGIPELLANGAGLLAPAKDSQGITDAMARLMTDDALRGSIAARGRQNVAERYSLDAVVTRYLELMGLPAYWPPRN
jgi:glycosyltransferase involved in cell wall biosynthesis